MTDGPAPAIGEVRQLFDVHAVTWSAKYAPDGPLAARLACLLDAVGRYVRPGDRVLDLGCGTGELARALVGTGLDVAGCDISPEMLRRAARDSSRVGWVQLEPAWHTLPFGTAAFDLVIAASVLEYVTEPAAVLRGCARVLRSKGSFCIRYWTCGIRSGGRNGSPGGWPGWPRTRPSRPHACNDSAPNCAHPGSGIAAGGGWPHQGWPTCARCGARARPGSPRSGCWRFAAPIRPEHDGDRHRDRGRLRRADGRRRAVPARASRLPGPHRRADVQVIGSQRWVSAAWLVRREMVGGRNGRRVALNNVGFFARGEHRWTLLRNALHFLSEAEAAAHCPTSLRTMACRKAAAVRLAAHRSDVLVVPSTSHGRPRGRNRRAGLGEGLRGSDQAVMRSVPQVRPEARRK